MEGKKSERHRCCHHCFTEHEASSRHQPQFQLWRSSWSDIVIRSGCRSLVPARQACGLPQGITAGSPFCRTSTKQTSKVHHSRMVPELPKTCRRQHIDAPGRSIQQLPSGFFLMAATVGHSCENACEPWTYVWFSIGITRHVSGPPMWVFGFTVLPSSSLSRSAALLIRRGGSRAGLMAESSDASLR